MFRLPDDRSYYDSDESFANFRPLTLNDCISKVFFRSASCISDRYGRRKYVAKLMQRHNISTIIDLSGINCRCTSNEFSKAFIEKLSGAIYLPGPYIVQCEAGKKRTGYACMAIEALSGTSLEKIIVDYLQSYVNNNLLSCDSLNKERKTIIEKTILPRLCFITGLKVNELGSSDLRFHTRKFFMSYMNSETLSRLEIAISPKRP